MNGITGGERISRPVNDFHVLREVLKRLSQSGYNVDLRRWIHEQLAMVPDNSPATIREGLEAIETYVEFYMPREISSPSNGEEGVRDAHDALAKFRAAMATLKK